MKLLKIAFIFALLFSFIGVNAQDTEIVVAQKDTFLTPDTWPEYPGGDQARLSYMAKNIVYPEVAKGNGEQGTVYVAFVVEKDGSISTAKILRGISPSLDEVALNTILGMPKWKPALKDAKPIRSQFNMPIKFILAGDNVSTDEVKLSRKEKRTLKKQKRAKKKNNK